MLTFGVVVCCLLFGDCCDVLAVAGCELCLEVVFAACVVL